MFFWIRGRIALYIVIFELGVAVLFVLVSKMKVETRGFRVGFFIFWFFIVVSRVFYNIYVGYIK